MRMLIVNYKVHSFIVIFSYIRLISLSFLGREGMLFFGGRGLEEKKRPS